MSNDPRAWVDKVRRRPHSDLPAALISLRASSWQRPCIAQKQTALTTLCKTGQLAKNGAQMLAAGASEPNLHLPPPTRKRMGRATLFVPPERVSFLRGAKRGPSVPGHRPISQPPGGRGEDGDAK